MNSNVLDENHTERKSNATEILVAQFQSLFGRSNRDAFLDNEGKIHEGRYVKRFFVNLQIGISQLHYKLTSSQIIFEDFKLKA